MSKKRDARIIGKGRQLSRKYHEKYGGCAQAVFAAVADSINLGYDKSAFKAMVGLSGGVARFGIGTCGAVAGAAAAMSVNSEIEREELQINKDSIEKTYNSILKFGKKFMEKYKALSCRDVQMVLYGMSFNLWDESARNEFRKVSDCDEVISDATAWALNIILNED